MLAALRGSDRLVAAQAVDTHLRALVDRRPLRSRWAFDLPGAALIAAAGLDPAIAPIVAGLRAGRWVLADDGESRPDVVEEARRAVAAALFWAWSALLGDGDEREWIVRGCLITQRATEERDRGALADHLVDVVDRANEALVRTAVLSSVSSIDRTLPRRPLTTGIGMLGAAHHLIEQLREQRPGAG